MKPFGPVVKEPDLDLEGPGIKSDPTKTGGYRTVAKVALYLRTMADAGASAYCHGY